MKPKRAAADLRIVQIQVSLFLALGGGWELASALPK
jgi:hypothetical protein